MSSMALASADVEYRCSVGGLAWTTTDQSLEQAFGQFGEVIESKIINDHETGRSRGFGFVTFKDDQSMRDAIEGMNGRDLDGRNITVKVAPNGGYRGGSRKPRRGGGNGRRVGGYKGGNGGGKVCGYDAVMAVEMEATKEEMVVEKAVDTMAMFGGFDCVGF